MKLHRSCMINCPKATELIGVLTLFACWALTGAARGEAGAGGKVVINSERTEGVTVQKVIPFKNQADMNRAVEIANGDVLLAAGTGQQKFTVEVIRDPSLAYQLEFHNLDNVPHNSFTSIDFSIDPLPGNTAFGELTVELFDENNDGEVLLIGDFGNANAIQGVSLVNTTTFDGVAIGPSLGTSISSVGRHEFILDPIAGPTLEGGDEISVSTFFTLSPGDRALITSRFIIDEGSGIPFAEIPPLPDPNDGPFFNVINVDSPETSLGDKFFIGSQTQLNLSDGGSIGDRFNFDALLNNQLQDNNFDIEVNVTGGTIGHQFMALSDTTVNISGGTHEGIFLAGHFNGLSRNVEVNITGGQVASGLAGDIQAYAGSEVNVSDGIVGPISAVGGTVNVSGGQFGNTAFPRLSIGMEVNLGGTLNLSGGSFFDEVSAGQISVFDGDLIVSGGTFLGGESNIEIRADGSLNLIGSEFVLDGSEVTDLIAGEPLTITERDVTLTGTLLDGSLFEIDLTSERPGFGERFDHVDSLAMLTISLPGALLAGDHDNDGFVGQGDLDLVLLNWGANATSIPGTWASGNVDQNELDAVLLNWGVGANVATTATIPEPATWLLSLVGIVLAALSVRSRREVCKY